MTAVAWLDLAFHIILAGGLIAGLTFFYLDYRELKFIEATARGTEHRRRLSESPQ